MVATHPAHAASPTDEGSGPLDAFVGKWVALDSPTDVLAAADTPQGLLRILDSLNREAKWGIVRIPTSPDEAEVVGPW